MIDSDNEPTMYKATKHNFLSWSRQNESRFPALAGVARCYLGGLCTSVASERLFNSAGHVFTHQSGR